MAKLNFSMMLVFVFVTSNLIFINLTSAADVAPTTATAPTKQVAVQAKPPSQMIEGTCKGKDLCLTVFVAPWCPLCNNSIPTIKSLHQQLSKIKPNMGLVVVVGEDNMENLVRKKNEILPVEVYTDSDGSFFRNRKIQGFPSWVVYDKDGLEIKRKVGEQRRSSTPELEDMIKNFLGT